MKSERLEKYYKGVHLKCEEKASSSSKGNIADIA
jgi:hypothetical protein